MKDAYKACVDYKLYDTYYDVKPMKNEASKFGGWPLLYTDYTEAEFSWNEVADIIADYGLPLFFNWKVVQDLVNAEDFQISVIIIIILQRLI